MKQLFTLFVTALTMSAFAQSPRTVLLEVSESTWTFGNSSVICAKEDVKSDYGDDLAVISYHWDDLQNGGDPMYQAFADEWAQTFFVTQWARAAMDRVSYDGTTMTSLDPTLWSDTIAARLNRTTDGLVTIPEVLHDPNTDEIFVRVQMDYSKKSIEIREMRFFLYVVQDGVEEHQLVDTNTLGSCTLFNDTLDTAKNFSHNDVAIMNPSTYEGTDNILPLTVEEGNRFHSVYTFNKPSGADLGDIRIVAFVANYDNGDVTKNRVINAAQESTFTSYDSSDPTDPNHPDNKDNPNSRFHPDNWPLGVNDTKTHDIGLQVRPNPVSDLALVKFNIPVREEVSVALYDLQGRKVQDIYTQTLAAGPQQAAFTSHALNQGIYIIRIAGESFVALEHVVVTH